jgi:F0F1-type ATP synthase membrane subunit c/vacuolar-type H+-ATPase subunit K
LGPLIMTALAAAAAAPAIGWISASTRRPVESLGRGMPSGRSLAIVSMAFCEGIAILGVVAGILAIFWSGPVAPSDLLLAGVLPVAGAILGVALVVRDRTTTDSRVAIQAMVFVLGLGVLGPVVSLLGSITARNRVESANPELYLILGLAQLLAIVGIARTSAGSIRSMQGADLATTRGILARQMLRSARLEFIGVISFVIALWLVLHEPTPDGLFR